MTYSYNASPAPTPPANGSTSTLWMWLSVAAQAASILVLLFIPWGAFTDLINEAAMSPTGDPSPETMTAIMVPTLLISLLALPIGLLPVLFSYLDWHTLGRRGVPAPFHWGFSAISIVISFGVLVYPIGRSVTLKKRGRPDWAPMWVSIAIQIVLLAVATGIMIWTFGAMIDALSQL